MGEKWYEWNEGYRQSGGFGWGWGWQTWMEVDDVDDGVMDVDVGWDGVGADGIIFEMGATKEKR